MKSLAIALLVAATALIPIRGRAYESLVTTTVDPTQLSALPHHDVAWAMPANDAGPVADDLALPRLTLVLRRSPQQQSAFDDLLREQQDPTSPNFHRWLTPMEIGERFGATTHDVEALSRWLESQGLTVEGVAPSRTRIAFSGSAAQIGAAFATALHVYRIDGEQRIAPIGPARIPRALSPVVESVRGLVTINERPTYRMEAGLSSSDPGTAPAPAGTSCSSGTCIHYIYPADFATVYDINPVYQQGFDGGGGQAIAIIGRARVNLADIENFQKLARLPPKDPEIIVPPAGVDPGPAQADVSTPASGDQVEATIDVTRATSVAPGATIKLVISASSTSVNGLAVASEYVVDTFPLIAQVMNLSFSICEADAGPSYVSFWDEVFRQAAAEGISVMVSSGDSGAAGCDKHFVAPPATQVASPSAICASSYATCVGGTEFADSPGMGVYWGSNDALAHVSALGYIPEGAWNEPIDSKGNPQVAATGGGSSSYVAIPPWQAGLAIPGANGRLTPDVSFSASAHDGYVACIAANGGSCVPDTNGAFLFRVIAGTSASAPSMAGIAALLNQKMGAAQGNLNPNLYRLAAAPGNGVFHDVTAATSGVAGCDPSIPSMCNNSTPAPSGMSGGLSGYPVAPGFDLATGLGSIDVAKILVAWASVNASKNYQGLWWLPGGTETGWGVNFVHQGDQIFATWYTYDIAGNAAWLSMLATRDSPASDTYLGPIYVDAGPPFNNYAGSATPTEIGVGRVTFSDVDNALFSYELGIPGTVVSQTKPITRFDLGTGPQPTCTYTATTPDLVAASNYQDLWWVANGAESGWGVNFAHQGDSIFATWYTYDLDGSPLWLSALVHRQGAGNIYGGTIYRNSGPRFDAYDARKVVIAPVGNVTITFTDGNHAAFAYSVMYAPLPGPVNQTKQITRFAFAATGGTICR